jgi:hypothetical protein
MKALTIWQPWASLIMVGATPFEFRKWDYRARGRSLEGSRIVVHAGARKVQPREVQEILLNLWGGEPTGLIHDPARELLVKIGFRPGDGGPMLPVAHGLGTAILGKPRKASEIFGRGRGDSDRIDQQIWAWPLTDIKHFEPPIPMRGAQGFWNWPERAAA